MALLLEKCSFTLLKHSGQDRTNGLELTVASKQRKERLWMAASSGGCEVHKVIFSVTFVTCVVSRPHVLKQCVT